MIDVRIRIPSDITKEMLDNNDEAVEAVRHVIFKVTNRVRNTALRKIKRGPKTGRIYKYKRKLHRSSAPGQAPATRPAVVGGGRLINSIMMITRNRGLTGVVGSPLRYALFLEEGTKKMKKRPWLETSLDDNEDYIINNVTRVLRKYMA